MNTKPHADQELSQTRGATLIAADAISREIDAAALLKRAHVRCDTCGATSWVDMPNPQCCGVTMALELPLGWRGYPCV